MRIEALVAAGVTDPQRLQPIEYSDAIHNSCARYYVGSNGQLQACVQNLEEQCTASPLEQAPPCAIEAILNRSRHMLYELKQHVRVLQHEGSDAALEQVAVATGDIFVPAVEVDLAIDPATRVLVYQSVLGGELAATATSSSLDVFKLTFEAHGKQTQKLACSMFGWIDPPHTIEQAAAQWPLDEAIALEGTLARHVQAARESRREPRLPAGWRRAPPQMSSIKLGIDADGFFTSEGSKVFLGGYNALDHHLGMSMEQQASSMAQLTAGTKRLPHGGQARLQTLGVNVIALEVPLMKLVTREMALDLEQARLIDTHLRWAASMNISLVLHVSQRMPEWATAQHDDLAMGVLDETGQHGVHYDIDHPIAHAVVRAALHGLVDFLGCRDNLVGYELSNEPAFRTTQSTHAKRAFASYLRRRYDGSLAALRQRWGELGLRSFEDAVESGWELQGKIDGKSRAVEAPPALGTAIARKLADWAAFNDARVLGWARAMVDAVHHNVSQRHCQRTFMRLNNALLLDNRLADHGVDRAALARLMDVHAFDSNFGWPTEGGSAASFDSPPAGYDTRIYCIDWLNYVAALSLLRGFDPAKPLLDTEMHTTSATKWRHHVGDDAGARATRLKVLLAAVLGQSGHFMWLWSRNRKGGALDATCGPGSFGRRCVAQAKWFAVSLLSQPRAFDSYAQATLLVRTHLPTLSLFAKERPHVWLLHSQSSTRLATLQTETTLALLEPLAFLGLPIGFIDADDPHIETTLTARLADGDWLLLPGNAHASAAALRAVRARVQTHPERVVAVDLAGSGYPAAQTALAFDTMGDRHSAFDRDYVPRLPSITVANEHGHQAETMHALERLLKPDAIWLASPPLRLVRCLEASQTYKSAAGVFSRSVALADAGSAVDLRADLVGFDDGDREGEVLFFVANLRNMPASVALLLSGAPPQGVFDVWSHHILENAPGQSSYTLQLDSGDAKLLLLRPKPYTAQPSPPAQPPPSPPLPRTPPSPQLPMPSPPPTLPPSSQGSMGVAAPAPPGNTFSMPCPPLAPSAGLQLHLDAPAHASPEAPALQTEYEGGVNGPPPTISDAFAAGLVLALLLACVCWIIRCFIPSRKRKVRHDKRRPRHSALPSRRRPRAYDRVSTSADGGEEDEEEDDEDGQAHLHSASPMLQTARENSDDDHEQSSEASMSQLLHQQHSSRGSARLQSFRCSKEEHRPRARGPIAAREEVPAANGKATAGTVAAQRPKGAKVKAEMPMAKNLIADREPAHQAAKDKIAEKEDLEKEAARWAAELKASAHRMAVNEVADAARVRRSSQNVEPRREQKASGLQVGKKAQRHMDGAGLELEMVQWETAMKEAVQVSEMAVHASEQRASLRPQVPKKKGACRTSSTEKRATSVDVCFDEQERVITIL